MTLQNALTVVAGILFFAGFVPYILAILRGETKPAKASWIIWGSLDTIALAAMYAKGALNGQIVGAVLGAWVIVALAMRYGTPGWKKLDIVCLGGAVLGIVLWQTFNDPLLGIITSQVVTLIGALPTWRSAWQDPSKEDKLAWTIFWLSCVVAVVAIPAWTLQDAAQPMTFFTIETIMMILLFVKPRFMTKKEELTAEERQAIREAGDRVAADLHRLLEEELRRQEGGRK